MTVQFVFWRDKKDVVHRFAFSGDAEHANSQLLWSSQPGEE